MRKIERGDFNGRGLLDQSHHYSSALSTIIAEVIDLSRGAERAFGEMDIAFEGSRWSGQDKIRKQIQAHLNKLAALTRLRTLIHMMSLDEHMAHIMRNEIDRLFKVENNPRTLNRGNVNDIMTNNIRAHVESEGG